MATPGSRIRNIRTAQRLSIEQLGRKTGISTETLGLIEKNKIVLEVDSLLKICTALATSTDFVLLGRQKIDKPFDIFFPLRKLLLDVYRSEKISDVFAALQGLTSKQIRLIIKWAKTMAKQNQIQKKLRSYRKESQ